VLIRVVEDGPVDEASPVEALLLVPLEADAAKGQFVIREE
jgi:hypothetical protein